MCRRAGVSRGPTWVSGCSTGSFVSRGGGRIQVRRGSWCGRNRLLNRVFHAVSHGQPRGRCRVRRRAEDAIRAGTVTRVRRMVADMALVRRPALGRDPAPSVWVSSHPTVPPIERCGFRCAVPGEYARRGGHCLSVHESGRGGNKASSDGSSTSEPWPGHRRQR